LIARSGVSISPRFSGTNTPLKIYHLMSTGVPLVATRIDSHTQVLTDELATLTGTSIEELAEGIAEVLRSPESARRKAALGQQWYEEHYSRNVYLSKMQKLFELVA
jgi:glycosyltransferase involved in cell wall biosynthesis